MSVPPLLPPVGELLDAPYEGSPFSEGITSDDYREQHKLHGEQLRWWKGYENATGARGPNGEVPARGGILRIEQPLPNDYRARIFEAKKTIMTAEFGIFEAGTAMISCLAPMQLAKGDVILRVNRTLLSRCAVEPSGEVVDELPYNHIQVIENVFTASGPLAADEYRATDGGIEWLGDIPSGFVFVEYRFHPLFEYLGNTDQNPPMGSDEQPLPQIGALRLIIPGSQVHV